jgi:hypothetical protein
MKTENLMFGHLGNGVVICDRNRRKQGDYMTVAHISYDRSVSYYTDILTEEAKYVIEDFARNRNMAISANNPDEYALCPLIFLTNKSRRK